MIIIDWNIIPKTETEIFIRYIIELRKKIDLQIQNAEDILEVEFYGELKRLCIFAQRAAERNDLKKAWKYTRRIIHYAQSIEKPLENIYA